MFKERYKSHHDASRNPKMRYTADTAGAEYLLAVLAGKAASRRVIYLHVPFCNKLHFAEQCLCELKARFYTDLFARTFIGK